jgi:hypothetical protein
MSVSIRGSFSAKRVRFDCPTAPVGMWIFGEGDGVYGLANHIGSQSILLAGIVMSGQMTVEIEAVGVSLPRAQAAFYKHGKIE